MKTVAELIIELLQLPQGAPVVLNGEGSFVVTRINDVVSIQRKPHLMTEKEFLHHED